MSYKKGNKGQFSNPTTQRVIGQSPQDQEFDQAIGFVRTVTNAVGSFFSTLPSYNSPTTFQIAGGSITGLDHTGEPDLPMGGNNQDSYAIEPIDGGQSAIGIVCDGCGSRPFSEVGSRLAAPMILNIAKALIERGIVKPEKLLQELQLEVIHGLEVLVELTSKLQGKPKNQVIEDCFYFTIVGGVVLKDRSFVFALGDGLYGINGHFEDIEPKVPNHPAYLAYWLQKDKERFARDIEVVQTISTKSLHSMLLGSDGARKIRENSDKLIPQTSEKVGGLGQFFDGQYFQNADAISRRLRVLNSRRGTTRAVTKEAATTVTAVFEGGILTDDTTIVSIVPVSSSHFSSESYYAGEALQPCQVPVQQPPRRYVAPIDNDVFID